ncbi:MAG TPA: SH3 domain-containing protein [Catalimonadaceae bacterium]|nr:SH3 domain-containing protein [Catalimonadaceae bacterium]
MLKLIKKQFVLIAFLLGYAPSFVASPLLKKADSLFAAQRFSESRELYSESFNVQKKTSKSDLLKLAFMEEGRDNAVLAIYYLHQFYLFQPENDVKIKIEEMANQNKFQGYSIDEADYAYFLYRTYGPLVEKSLFGMAIALFLFLAYRKIKGVSLGYSPVFTLLFLAASAYFFNFSLPYKRAIVSDEKIFMMSGPSAGSSVVAMLDKGHRLEWTGEEDIWYEVKWNEKKGWVKKTGLLFFL